MTGVLSYPNRILLLISQRHISLTGTIQPGNKKGLMITDYSGNFKIVGWGLPRDVFF
jgi:hypothetical protein